MKIKFSKMHGAGNDFIVVDDRLKKFPASNPKWIGQLCSYHIGIGSEGLILVQPAARASFRMRFFNPDGGEVGMCGNGLRCVARFAYDHKIAGRKMTIQTNAGVLRAAIVPNGVRVDMPVSPEMRLNFPVKVANRNMICSLVNTGVPHAVIKVDNSDRVDLGKMGPLLRWHKAFAPRGANVDYMSITGRHAIKVRTYERGVEAETLACGTGMTACAIVAVLNYKVKLPVSVTCRHGDVLEVDFKRNGNIVRDVTLSGPAVTVFEGEISYKS